MSRLDLGVSPNTLALVFGLGAMGLICSNSLQRPCCARTAWGWAGLLLCIVALAGTQSRGACLGLLTVTGLWFGLYRKAARTLVIPLFACATALFLWLALAGRSTPSALHTGASVRQWVHAAALMQAGEAFFSTSTRVGGLAEDAAMRFGFPLGLEQGRMIQGALSTLLAWLDPLRWPFGLLGWIGLIAPACLWPQRTLLPPGGLSLGVPSAALFTVICAAFNCLHQDRLGSGLLPLLAIAGWVWLGVWLWRRRPLTAALGLSGALVAAGMLLASGYFLLRQNFMHQGVDAWHVSRVEAGADGGEIAGIAATSIPRGTLILFDHAPDTPASWTCRRALFRQVADKGWKLVWASGIGVDSSRLDQVGLVAPIVVAGMAGPVPENIARILAPTTLVHIDGGLVVWLTPDGASPEAERHWVATHARSEADLARAVILANTSAHAPPNPHRIPAADHDAWRAFWDRLIALPRSDAASHL